MFGLAVDIVVVLVGQVAEAGVEGEFVKAKCGVHRLLMPRAWLLACAACRRRTHIDHRPVRQPVVLTEHDMIALDVAAKGHGES